MNSLKSVMQKQNLCQADMAKKLGVSQATISLIVHGKRLPSFDVLKVLHKKFNVDLNNFITKYRRK